MNLSNASGNSIRYRPCKILFKNIASMVTPPFLYGHCNAENFEPCIRFMQIRDIFVVLYILFLGFHAVMCLILCSYLILQNKILHSQLEALHIQLAERDRNSSGISSGSTAPCPHDDTGLQNVINYLRRSKEIVSIDQFRCHSSPVLWSTMNFTKLLFPFNRQKRRFLC